MNLATRIDLSERETNNRMLAKAHRDGVRILEDPNDGRCYATSNTDPSRLHYVTGFTCDCRGFVHHGHCKHHAALLEYMGWLGNDPPTRPVSGLVPCNVCDGSGAIEQPHSRWIGGSKTGFRDEWSTRLTCEACAGTGLLDVEANAEHRDQAWEESPMVA